MLGIIDDSRVVAEATTSKDIVKLPGAELAATPEMCCVEAEVGLNILQLQYIGIKIAIIIATSIEIRSIIAIIIEMSSIIAMSISMGSSIVISIATSSIIEISIAISSRISIRIATCSSIKISIYIIYNHYKKIFQSITYLFYNRFFINL